jgi:hypothetical protein
MLFFVETPSLHRQEAAGERQVLRDHCGAEGPVLENEEPARNLRDWSKGSGTRAGAGGPTSEGNQLGNEDGQLGARETMGT